MKWKHVIWLLPFALMYLWAWVVHVNPEIFKTSPWWLVPTVMCCALTIPLSAFLAAYLIASNK